VNAAAISAAAEELVAAAAAVARRRLTAEWVLAIQQLNEEHFGSKDAVITAALAE
jgi:hypothetical protein